MYLLLLSHFSRVRLCDPIDGSPPGSAVPGILQARVLEWGAIAFSRQMYEDRPFHILLYTCMNRNLVKLLLSKQVHTFHLEISLSASY